VRRRPGRSISLAFLFGSDSVYLAGSSTADFVFETKKVKTKTFSPSVESLIAWIVPKSQEKTAEKLLTRQIDLLSYE
jgi:hypothetical protein